MHHDNKIIQVVWVFQLVKGRMTYYGKLRTKWPVIPMWKEGRFLGFVSIRDRLICMLTLMKFTKIFLVSSSTQTSMWTPKLNAENEHHTSVYLHSRENSFTKLFKIKQDWHCTYNGTLSPVRVTTATVGKQ